MKWFIFCFITVFVVCSCNNKSSEHGKSAEVNQAQRTDSVRGKYSGEQQVLLDKKYCNTRYGYCVSYPEHIVKMLPEAENGDGRIFNNEEGKEFGRIYRSLSHDPEGAPVFLKQQMDRDIEYLQKSKGGEPVAIAYSKTGKDFYVISAEINRRIYYRKVIVKREETATLLFEYDKEQKSKYDDIVAAMSKSFYW